MGGQDSVVGRNQPNLLESDGAPQEIQAAEARNNLVLAAGLAGNASTADMTAAPDSKFSRYMQVTAEGAKNLPAGMWHAVVENVTHPVETFKMVASSAALGAVLKTGLPEKVLQDLSQVH